MASRRSGTRSTPTRCCNKASVTSAPPAPALRPTFPLHASNASARTAAPRPPTSPRRAGPAGRSRSTSTRPGSGARRCPSNPTYDEVRTAIRTAFQNVTDPANPGKQVILKIMNKEELRNVDGSDSLHPNRSGDVVVVTRPPYQSDAGTPDQDDRPVPFLRTARLPAEHGRPEAQRQHARHVRAGRAVHQAQGQRPGTCAPSTSRRRLSFLMGIPGPQNARGAILYDLIKGGSDFDEVTILDISDWHAQLTPLAEAADTLGTDLRDRRRGVPQDMVRHLHGGGHAERSARRAPPSVIEVAGGDSFGGATPPISNFFGDKPTPPIMGMMGIDIDALGNHSFDRGGRPTCEHADPARAVPDASRRTSSTRTGRRRRSGRSRRCSTFRTASKLGVIGFTTESTPEVVFPGNLGPFEVRPDRAGRQRRGGQAGQEDRRDRRARPRGRDRRHGHQPDRSVDRHRRHRPQGRRRHRRPQRPPGQRAPPERRARHREPRQGHPVHPDAARHRRPTASSTRRPTTTSRGTSA